MSDERAPYGVTEAGVEPGKRRRQRMHRNSLDTYHLGRPEQHARCRAIIEEIRRGGPGTDHELATRLGLRHRQDVAPRVTTLLDLKFLAEVGVRRDERTHKPVRVVGLVEPSALARKAWRETMLAAGPGLKPMVADQLNLGL